MRLHDLYLDPLWKSAADLPVYAEELLKRPLMRNTLIKRARQRVYAWLEVQLGLDEESTHVGMFDMETCARATELLQGTNYPEIRKWAERRKKSEQRARKRRRQAPAQQPETDTGLQS